MNIPLLSKLFSSGCKILFYHGVEFEIFDPLIQSLHLRMDIFERQIKHLIKHYKIISLQKLINSLINGHKINSRWVVLTFDDGYKNNHDIVLPYLASIEIPFSVFISTKNIDNNQRFIGYLLRLLIFKSNVDKISLKNHKDSYDISSKQKKYDIYNQIVTTIKTSPQVVSDRLYNDIINHFGEDHLSELNNIYSSDEPMSWKEVINLKKNGTIIGSHFHDHLIPHDNQKVSLLKYQISRSKDLIIKHIGECDYFAYPNGRFQDISVDAYNLIKKEYKLGLTTFGCSVTSSSNRYLLPRIFPHSNLNNFKNRLKNSPLAKKLYKSEIIKYDLK